MAAEKKRRGSRRDISKMSLLAPCKKTFIEDSSNLIKNKKALAGHSKTTERRKDNERNKEKQTSAKTLWRGRRLFSGLALVFLPLLYYDKED